MREESPIDKVNFNSSNSHSVHRKVVNESIVACSSKEQILQPTEGMSFYWKGKAHAIPESLRAVLAATTIEEEDQVRVGADVAICIACC